MKISTVLCACFSLTCLNCGEATDTGLSVEQKVSSITGGCWEESCNGEDPERLCKDDAWTVESVPLAIDGKTTWPDGTPYGTLELRWSDACHANWARVTSPALSTTLYSEVNRDDGARQIGSTLGRLGYSAMLNGYRHKVYACGNADHSWAAARACTRSH